MKSNIRKRMLRQDITIYKYTNTNGNGVRVYATPYVVKGYVTGKLTQITDFNGILATSAQQVFLDGADMPNVTSEDLIVLPGSLVKYPIIALTPFRGQNDVLEYGVVYLK